MTDVLSKDSGPEDEKLNPSEVKQQVFDGPGITLEQFTQLETSTRDELIIGVINQNNGADHADLFDTIFKEDNISSTSPHYTYVSNRVNSLRSGQMKIHREKGEYHLLEEERPEDSLGKLIGPNSPPGNIYRCLVCGESFDSSRKARVHKSKEGHNKWEKELETPDGWTQPEVKS